jgi:phenylalanyl-tRNA synthetase beta chain
LEKSRDVDVYDAKQVVIQTLEEAGFNPNKLFIDDNTPNYFHPGKSGRVFLNKGKEHLAAYFGELHPNIIKKLDIKTEALVGFEIFIDNLKTTKKSLNDQKSKFEVSDYQKSERDFAFIVDKNFISQDLIDVIYNVDKNLIKEVKIFDVYHGENIPEDKKSIAINVSIQSNEKTLKEQDLDLLNKSIIELVEKKTGAKIRS